MSHTIKYENTTEQLPNLTELFDLAQTLHDQQIPFKIEYDTKPQGKVRTTLSKFGKCVKGLKDYRMAIAIYKK